MRSYHSGARRATPAHGKDLHTGDAPSLQFEVRGDTLHRTGTDNRRLPGQYSNLSLSAPVDVLLEAKRRGMTWAHLTGAHATRYQAALSAFWKAPAFDGGRGFGKARAFALDAMTTPDEPQQHGLSEVTFA